MSSIVRAAVERGRAASRRELVDRVERQELEPGPRVELRRRRRRRGPPRPPPPSGRRGSGTGRRAGARPRRAGRSRRPRVDPDADERRRPPGPPRAGRRGPRGTAAGRPSGGRPAAGPARSGSGGPRSAPARSGRPARPSPGRSTRRGRRPRRAGRSPEEGRRDTRVDRDVEPGRLAQVAAGQGEHRGRDVLGQDLALEQRPLGVELAELVLGDAVGPGPVGAPALGEDPRAADDAVGVDAVDPDPELAELGGEQPDLVGLVGLRRAVGDVVRARRRTRSC